MSELSEFVRQIGNQAFDDGPRPGPAMCWKMADRIEALETKNARLREALEKYGRCKMSCGMVGGYGQCTCGFSAALGENSEGEAG